MPAKTLHLDNNLISNTSIVDQLSLEQFWLFLTLRVPMITKIKAPVIYDICVCILTRNLTETTIGESTSVNIAAASVIFTV